MRPKKVTKDRKFAPVAGKLVDVVDDDGVEIEVEDLALTLFEHARFEEAQFGPPARKILGQGATRHTVDGVVSGDDTKIMIHIPTDDQNVVVREAKEEDTRRYKSAFEKIMAEYPPEPVVEPEQKPEDVVLDDPVSDMTTKGDTAWEQAAAGGGDIVPDDHDAHDEDIANSLSSVLKKDDTDTEEYKKEDANV